QGDHVHMSVVDVLPVLRDHVAAVAIIWPDPAPASLAVVGDREVVLVGVVTHAALQLNRVLVAAGRAEAVHRPGDAVARSLHHEAFAADAGAAALLHRILARHRQHGAAGAARGLGQGRQAIGRDAVA